MHSFGEINETIHMSGKEGRGLTDKTGGSTKSKGWGKKFFMQKKQKGKEEEKGL